MPRLEVVGLSRLNGSILAAPEIFFALLSILSGAGPEERAVLLRRSLPARMRSNTTKRTASLEGLSARRRVVGNDRTPPGWTK